ncbi:ACS, partial [Symbiodinium necroappetens]
MALVSFMTNTCGWGLKFIDGCNLGRNGQIREMQMKFTAPHPLNLVAPHLMIDLRQAGYI